MRIQIRSARTSSPSVALAARVALLGATVAVASAFRSSTDASAHSDDGGRRRSCATEADRYFQRWREIPPPPRAHEDLRRLLAAEEEEDSKRVRRDDRRRVLVVGDVHGCLDELIGLVRKATDERNGGREFAAIVLVGDLVNKGPSSARVVSHVRTRPRWFSVRGNHDNGALAAALGDERRLAKPTYRWVVSTASDDDNDDDHLSDEDVDFLSRLPYTITIPKETLSSPSSAERGRERDVIVVHAGLDPVVELERQDIKTMVTLRDLKTADGGESKAWAKVWEGPELVVFGHDAKRGLQIEPHALGLDTGCVYGKKLTGVILPERELVSVDAIREHCPIAEKKA